MRNKLITFCKRWAVIIVIGGIFGLNLFYWTRGDLLSLLLSVGIAAWNIFLLATAALLANALGVRRFAKFCVMGINMVVIGVFVTIVLGYGAYLQDIDAVKRYREPLVFSLEAYKNQHGRYPDRLSAVTGAYQGKPRLIEDTILYYNTGDRFLLSFFDPNPEVRFWVYDSAQKRWKVTDR